MGGNGEVLSPSNLWNLLRSRVPEPAESVRVEGIFAGFNHDREYAGRRYGRLLDPNDGTTSITLRIPKLLVPEFVGREGAVFTLFGVPYWDIKPEFGRAEVVLDVREVEGVDSSALLLEEKALLIDEKLKKGWRDVERILRESIASGRKPRVCIFVGETAVVDADVLRALGEERENYELEIRRVSFTDRNFLMEALRGADAEGFDLIAVVRGGGSGLEVFDDTELAGAVISLETPVVTALGHAEDLHFLDRVADRYFITPTDLGRFLAEVSESVGEVEKLRRKVEELEKEKLDLFRNLASLDTERKNLEEEARNLKLRIEGERKERENLLRELQSLKEAYSGLESGLLQREDRIAEKERLLQQEREIRLTLTGELEKLRGEVQRLAENLRSYEGREKIYRGIIVLLLVGFLVIVFLRV